MIIGLTISFFLSFCPIGHGLINGKFWKDSRTLALPRFHFDELFPGNKKAQAAILDALNVIGALEIIGIPDFTTSRHSSLSTLSDCLHSDEKASKMLMTDGSSRLTIDAFDNEGVLGKIESSCGDSVYELRNAVDLATKQLFSAFDDMPFSKSYVMEPYKSFSDILRFGDHLEHFHSYFGTAAGGQSSIDLATIDFHVDAGLMIAMTSGLHTGKSPAPDSGLYIELQDGEIVRVFPSDDSLIILVGEGGSQWFKNNLNKPFRAVPHALYANLPDNTSTRSWYGKMILPPSNAIIPTANMTYKDYRTLQHQIVHEQTYSNSNVIPAGCSSDFYSENHRNASSYGTTTTVSLRKLQAANTCMVTGSVPGIMCWMKCVTVAALSCSNTDAVCYDPDSNSIVSGGKSYMNAKPMCAKDIIMPEVAPEKGYCQGTGTTMFMDGFAGIGSSPGGETLCINFLFQTWTLNTRVKFAFACIGTLLAGILVQFIAKARVDVTRAKWSNKLVKKAVLVFLFMSHITFGYFLMLLAMTYNVELFCMVCVGLTIGYAVFNIDETPAVAGEPCCAENAEVSGVEF